VAGLKLQDVFLNDGYAFVTEKGNKTRKVHFTPFTAHLLNKWLKERACLQTVGPLDDHVFVNVKTGQGLTFWGIQLIFRRLKERAGVNGRVNPHSFRHFYGIRFMTKGGDSGILSKLMGHNNVQTTLDYYAIFRDDELHDLHEKHSPISGLFDETPSGSQVGEDSEEKPDDDTDESGGMDQKVEGSSPSTHPHEESEKRLRTM
jgi:integrase/recombinase XerD